jgi:predicted CopG family antitoxin
MEGTSTVNTSLPLMPEKRPGLDVIRLFLDERLKEKFKRICSIKGTTMTEEITKFIEESVNENDDLLKLVDKKLGGKA